MNLVALEQAEAPLVLALDVGTSSCRALLYDAQARQVEGIGHQIPYTPRTTADGGAELDADELVGLVCGAIDTALEEGRARLGDLRAVATCSFWHSLLGVDAAGRAATPIYLWMDARSRHQADALKAQLDEQAVHGRTGCVLHWSYWPAKLLWLSETAPQLFSRVRRFVSFGEYLALTLLGESTVSISMASGTGLFNHHANDWDDELLAALPIGRERLAQIDDRPRTADRGPSAARWPALANVPWLPALGDGACSNLGAGCATRERRALMVGTSGALRVLWTADDVQIPWGAWCYRADRRRFVLGGAINDGGSLLAWLRESLRLPPLEELERVVAALEPDGHGLTILPLWAGERSPGWAADAQGALIGLRLHTSPAEIYRAALEAIGLYFARIDAILRRVVPEVRQVVATGGALLHSPAWLQIMADVLGQEVLASSETEASSRGAALLALEALGALPAGLAVLDPPIGETYRPVPANTERYRAAAERQSRLYEMLIGAGVMA